MGKYFKDKQNIFKYQNEDEVLVLGEQVAREVKSRKCKVESEILVARNALVPKAWKIKILGEHNRANIACAILVCQELEVPTSLIKKGVESFVGVPGRLELVRTVGGVKYYNDTTATTPDGNRAALLALADKKNKNIVLIAGGADKELCYTDMARLIHKTVKVLVLIEGAATEKLLAKIPKTTSYPVYIVDNMKDAIDAAREFAKKGDIVLLSPGAASFGVFKNEFDRGDQFVKLVKKI